MGFFCNDEMTWRVAAVSCSGHSLKKTAWRSDYDATVMQETRNLEHVPRGGCMMRKYGSV